MAERAVYSCTRRGWARADEGAGASECARRRECAYGESVRGVACAACCAWLCAVVGTRWRCWDPSWDRGCVLMIWRSTEFRTRLQLDARYTAHTNDNDNDFSTTRTIDHAHSTRGCPTPHRVPCTLSRASSHYSVRALGNWHGPCLSRGIHSRVTNRGEIREGSPAHACQT